MNRIAPLLIAALSVASAACSDTTAPLLPNTYDLPLPEQAITTGVSARRLASVSLTASPPQLVAPSTAKAGQPVDVAVTTFGGGCIAYDTIAVVSTAQRVDIVPYNKVYQPGPNGACTRELRIFTKTVSVVFAKSGLGLVRLVGRAGSGDSLQTITRTVIVE